MDESEINGGKNLGVHVSREINDLKGLIGELTIANETLKEIHSTKSGKQ